MSITNYTTLQAAIADYVARSDLTASIPDFIALAEARFNRVLRVRDMEALSSLTLTTGAATLPTDYIEWLSAQWVGTRTQDLRYVEPDSEDWRRRYRPNGDPQLFTIMAGKVIIRPITTGSLAFYYYQKIPALATASTNWLLTKSPDLYLYTALSEAMQYVKDDARRDAYTAIATNALTALIGEADSNKLARRGEAHMAAQTDQQASASGVGL
jgi:hypothetical protein